MREDKKNMPPSSAPVELPMPKYDYQKPQDASISAPYRSSEPRETHRAPALQNVHFG